MVHGNPVAYTDGAKRDGRTAGRPYPGFHGLQDFVKMDMARDNFVVGVRDADQGAVNLFIRVTHCFQQRAMGGPFDSFFYEVASHGCFPAISVINELCVRFMPVMESTQSGIECQANSIDSGRLRGFRFQAQKIAACKIALIIGKVCFSLHNLKNNSS